ncbi:MAG: hypothetical protein RLZZ244_1227 [Verrucomicrobiota bacterium]
MESLRRAWWLVPVWLLAWNGSVLGAAGSGITPEQEQFFENKVRPILAKHCIKCHSVAEGKMKGGLGLDNRAATLKGGETGPAVKPGDLRQSLLIKAVVYDDPDLQMPPKGEKLSTEQIDTLKEWVLMGAPDPREGEAGKGDSSKQHWAFQPVSRPAPPTVKNAAWCKNSVDKFILAGLEAKEMVPAPPASKETLLRRAYFDLIGLPPSPREIQAFVSDASPNAFEKVLDQLLSSPRYGERWARHWLDTARYSDTKGFIPENSLEDYRYPFAYTYRDWVIKAFNSDMPYDQFVMNQLAADKIPGNAKENLAALAFLTVGKRFQDREEVVADRIDAIGRGLQGLTLACARCHDHKFDPVSMKDYYALRGVFESCMEPGALPVIGGDANSKEYQAFVQRLETYEKENVQAFYVSLQELSGRFRQNPAAYLEAAYLTRRAAEDGERRRGDNLISAQKLDLNVLDAVRVTMRGSRHPVMGPFIRVANGGDINPTGTGYGKGGESGPNSLVVQFLKDKMPEDDAKKYAAFGKFFALFESKAAGAFQTLADAKSNAMAGPEAALMQVVTFPFDAVPGTDLTDYETVRKRWISMVPFRLRNVYLNRSPLAKISELMIQSKGGPVRAMALEDLPKPVDSPIFPRGNKPPEDAPVVPRRFVEILSGGEPEPFEVGSGRYELARAIVSKENPLTARVMVNRVWMHHFGEGLVRTPDDLGNQAGRPTHPELLDFLSAWFMQDFGPAKPAWSIKGLHKAIMMSQAYQQSSHTSEQQQVKDPGNTMVWRANVRRMDFESFRDSLISMAGMLDPTMYGPPVNIVDEPYSYRRSIYGYVDRGNMPDLLMQFDVSNPVQPNSKRKSTIVPQQALFLMNSPFVVSVAKRIVARPEVARAENDRQRILGIYQIVLQRTPSKEEYDLAVSFLTREAKFQAAEIAATVGLTQKAQGLAEKDLNTAMKGSTNQLRNMTSQIVNEGSVVDRVRLSPWETLVQSLLFSNEVAYVN